MDETTVVAKYKDIIAEEVNVKDVVLLDDAVVVTTTYVPLGQKLGAVFGKDTSLIISSAKQGQATLQPDGSLLVSSGENSWMLAADMFETRYSGLQEDYQTVEGGVIVSLDMTITDELKKEGVARELSRFLNQMRKDADLQIDTKIGCVYQTDQDYFDEIIAAFGPFLQDEALLARLEKTHTGVSLPLFQATFSSDEGTISFSFLQ